MADFQAFALDALQVSVLPSSITESRSRAGVQRVSTATGESAYLKLTAATTGRDGVDAARRELRFYQHVAAGAPLRTPKLLGFLDTEDGIGLLLEATGDSVEIHSWTQDMWTELGGALAKLHDMPVPATWDKSRRDGLLEAMADPDEDQVRAFWSSSLSQLDQILAERAALSDQLMAAPEVFVHGDCHTGNVLQAEDASLVFCDWQSTGLGRPSSDLAFLMVRAAPSGVVPPRALLDAYSQASPARGHTLDRSVLAEELAILVFLWPPFAAYNDERGVIRVRQRTSQRADQWLAG